MRKHFLHPSALQASITLCSVLFNVEFVHIYNLNLTSTIVLHHRHGKGVIAQTNDGKLLVIPGTIVHMECLFMRRHGTPEWKIQSTSGRTYPQVRVILI